MQLSKKNNVLLFAVIFSAIAALIILFGQTSCAYGAEETKTSPEIYCVYTDSNGDICDGDNLTAGDYDVSFYAKGFNKISVLEITAAYDTAVVSVNNIVDNITSMKSMGSVTENGNFVVGYVSEGDYVDVNPDSEFIVSVNMSFSIDCDAADYIKASLDPNLFFVVDDSAEGNYDDEYSLVDSFNGYNGSLALMSCNISPAMTTEDTYNVSGQIEIATDINGGSTTAGIVGITVNVIDDSNNTIASDVTDENGYYNLVGIPAGTYKMLISGPTTVDREVILNVTESKTLDSVGIVICDYNHDNKINAFDKSTFLSSFTGDYYVYCDFNADGKVNAFDKSYFLAFFNKVVDYDELTLY